MSYILTYIMPQHIILKGLAVPASKAKGCQPPGANQVEALAASHKVTI